MVKKSIIITIGISILLFMIYLLIFRQQQFDPSLFGVFTVGIGLVMYAILEPASLKIGSFEIIEKAKQATSDAEKAAHLANEIVAMLLWNNGRWESKTRVDEAKKLMTNLYGKQEANRKIQKFVKEGLFEVSDEERVKILNEKFEVSKKEEESPLYNLLIKSRTSND